MHWRVPLSCAVSRWRKQKNSASLRLNQRCIAVLDFTHDAILAIDENGRIQVLNPPAERIMGCRAADSVGQPVEAVLPNTLLPDVLESGEKRWTRSCRSTRPCATPTGSLSWWTASAGA